MTNKVFISQTDRFKKNHGAVHRSSEIFYYRYSSRFRTQISLMNHFKHKIGADVALLASVRSMDGRLISRENLDFEQGEVVVYSPLFDDVEEFEGSVEIEAFSSKDLKIPFTAISAIYSAENSASLVHAYGRVYSTHEIEEGKTVPIGREGGWTVRDSESVRSFAVLHNGAHTQPPQTILLQVRNFNGDVKSSKIECAEMNPFSTLKIYPSDYIEELSQFLDAQDGTANLEFVVNGAFTRLLVGNETKNGSHFHVIPPSRQNPKFVVGYEAEIV